MTVQINGTSGLVFNDASTQNTAATGFGFKNRLINSAMMIDQRNAGASVTNVLGGVYTLDRWSAAGFQASKFTAQQSSTAPTGFKNSLLVTSSSAYTVGAGEYFDIDQPIEGLNIADLGWGTASAATVTLSFWVRSSLTGTFGGALNNSGDTRSYPFTYTISAANTWEQKTVTIAGDTTGTWLTTNGIGIRVRISLGAGSTYSGTAGAWAGTNYNSATGATSVVGTNGATFYITGVQLEKGSTATSFDYRPYGTELNLCQRYYWQRNKESNFAGICSGMMRSNTGARLYAQYPIQMRASPTISFTNIGNLLVSAGTSDLTPSTPTIYANTTGAMFDMPTTTGTVGQGAVLIFSTTDASLQASAEL